ncbi:hypothetical protein ACHAXS_001835 [Conticribra weissflogii]
MTTCPGGLHCHHGGECAVGDKSHADDGYAITADLPWLEELNRNGEHCINCHDGWGGVDCNRKYQQCDPDDPDSPTCFHGGECYKMGISPDTGEYEYMCDCTKSNEGSLRYAGEFCQHLEDDTCGDEMYCTNGGKCFLDIVGRRGLKQYVCKCPVGRTGTHCEFSQDHQFEECSLECARGVCAKGFKDYDYLVGTGPFPASLVTDLISSSGEHCVCPTGWTGLKCDIEVKRCSAKKYCYNGSTCIYDSKGEPYCDCNTASTDEKSFAGLSCEHEGTSYCDPSLEQDQKDAFCANGGQCISDPLERHEGCVCPDGWTGDLCDIRADDEEHEEEDCNLNCENGGSCRFGVKGYKDSYDELDLAVYYKKHKDGMYCSCPDGFTGLQCEVDITHCHAGEGGDNDHFCLNGTPCSLDDPKFVGVDKKYECQCSEAGDEITDMLAGRYCEYAVTEFCSHDKRRHTHSWCTNGGKCKVTNSERDTTHHGCCCPDGFEGEYCHLPKGSVKEGTPITWSPLEECQHKQQSSPEHLLPFSSGDIETKSSANDDMIEAIEVDIGKEAVAPVVVNIPRPESKATSSHKVKSNVAAITSCLLAIVLVGGLVVYRKSKQSKDIEQHRFDANAVWPPPMDSSFAPARTWQYPPDHSMSTTNASQPNTWDHSKEFGDLHNVVI